MTLYVWPTFYVDTLGDDNGGGGRSLDYDEADDDPNLITGSLVISNFQLFFQCIIKNIWNYFLKEYRVET